MNADAFLAAVKGRLIVSCQALEDEPLHGADIMAQMAVAAKVGGAAAIRANGPDDIRAIKRAGRSACHRLVQTRRERRLHHAHI